VLILPPGHWQSVTAPRQLRPRDKWIIGTVLALLAAGAVALVISFASTSGTSGNGCIDITAAAATGGTELRRCGAEARLLCSSVRANEAGVAGFAALLPEACRKAGLPVAR
jgi:hypothetical protein